MPIQDLIQSALVNRESLRNTYEQRKNTISAWNRRVKAIQKTFRTDDVQLWERMVESTGQQNIWTQIKEILDGNQTTQGLITNLKELGDGVNPGVFTTAYNRVSRKYINIGVVGAFRQGKSTILKQLICPISEQLSSRDIIPTNNGGLPCTGTSVNYINSDYDIPAEIRKHYPAINGLPQEADAIPRAVVTYNTTKDICETINKYIEECKLNWDKINTGCSTISKSDLIEYCQNHRDKALSIPNAQENTLGATFKNIILEYEKYLDLLDRPDTLINDLRLSANRDDFYKRSTFNYDGVTTDNYSVYAVKMIDVFIGFKVANEEVGPIQFLDTPGVGEKRVGVDETLKEKLLNEIDSVIAIEKAHDQAVPAEALISFHSSLTDNYGEKQSKFIYYIINDATAGNLTLINQAYIRAFKNGIEKTMTPIVLPQERKILVDCERNYVYDYISNGDGSISDLQLNNTKNCQTILYSIVSNLANNIERIDKDFTAAADGLFGIVHQQINDLQRLANAININIGNNNVDVNRTVQELCTELSLISHNSIVDTIVLKIKEYAKNEDVGREVLYSLRGLNDYYNAVLSEEKITEIIDSIKNEQDAEKKSSLFAEHTFNIIGKNGPCTSIEYENWREFRAYSDIKCNLNDLITEKVQDLVSPKPIQSSLEIAQNELYDIFRKDKYLGFLCNRDEGNGKWYKRLSESISDTIWKNRFDQFFSYDVTSIVQDFINREIISRTILKFMHNDNFANSSFNTLQNANISFLKSLWKIENAIKKSLRNEDDSILEDLKREVNDDFIAKRRSAINFQFGAPRSMNNQIVHFVSLHYNEILKRQGIIDELQRKQALYNQWQEVNK